MRVLSIDPGFGRCGFAVMEKGSLNKYVILFSECFETDTEANFSERLEVVGKKLEVIIKKYNPDIVAIEKIFFQKNKKTAMDVSQVIGALSYIAESAEIPVKNYTPNEVKSSITGNGNANKKQVEFMVKQMVDIDPNKKMIDDEYDAIAVGITCLSDRSV